MLIRDGYGSINIKTVAGELGCSTQPISRHFGNMDAFRTELTAAAGQYVKNKLDRGAEAGAPETFGQVYCNIAMEQPNLFRFVCMGESGRQEKDSMASWLNYGQNTRVMAQVMDWYGLSRENAGKYVQTMIIYSHGIACLIASGMIVEKRETVYEMLRGTGKHCLSALVTEQRNG